mmetsp:Transcript_25083/g.34638  ORF Transcript_25083/g.34638 Transcript_25083/m.34638 type:complete len:207 (+) Transcript_25083:564-1184(+)
MEILQEGHLLCFLWGLVLVLLVRLIGLKLLTLQVTLWIGGCWKKLQFLGQEEKFLILYVDNGLEVLRSMMMMMKLSMKRLSCIQVNLAKQNLKRNFSNGMTQMIFSSCLWDDQQYPQMKKLSLVIRVSFVKITVTRVKMLFLSLKGVQLKKGKKKEFIQRCLIHFPLLTISLLVITWELLMVLGCGGHMESILGFTLDICFILQEK